MGDNAAQGGTSRGVGGTLDESTPHEGEVGQGNVVAPRACREGVGCYGDDRVPAS